MEQLPILREALMEQFEDQEVPLYEVEGELFLAGEDLGRILGLAEPRKAIAKIYQRNREELQPHIRDTKMVSPSSRGTRSGGPQTTRLYSEVGCYLITMFAKTKKARQVRQWLASLPQRIRAAAPASWQEALERAHFGGFGQAIKMFVDINAGKTAINKLLSVIRWRLLGLSAADVAKLVGLSLATVQRYERLMSEHGMVFPKDKGLSQITACSIGSMLHQADKERASRKTGPNLKRIK